MKKIVIFLLCSMFLYGAGLQVATPQVDLKEFKNAKNIPFVEADPVQFTINIPLDLDVIKGRKIRLESSTATGSFVVSCVIWSHNDTDIKYEKRTREIQPGQQTVTFKFNGISINEALKINRYTARLSFMGGGNTYSTKVIIDVLEIDHTYLSGVIE